MMLKQDKYNRVSSSNWQLSTGICLSSFRKPHYNGSKGIENETNERFQFLDDKKQTEMFGQKMRQKKT